MKIDEIINEMLDRDWTVADLKRAADLLAELEASPEAKIQAARIDRLRGMMMRKASAEVEPKDGWDAFLTRMNSACFSSSRESHHSRFEDRKPSGIWQRRLTVNVFQAALLQAAVLLLAASAWLWYLGVFGNQRPVTTAAKFNPGSVHRDQAFARMSPGEVEQQVGLFGNVASVFDDRAKWVAVSDAGPAQMGLASTAMPMKGKLILLRLAVLKAGHLLSRSDLALVPGQDADITLPFDAGQEIHYQISATATHPTRLSLWAQLQRPGEHGQTLAALATELSARPGDLIKAGELNTSTGDYQFQLGVFEGSQNTLPAPAPKEQTP